MIVLKFGSSVLTGPAAFPAAVHEIYRYLRQGEKVVAVVSAMENRTNALLAEAMQLGDEPPPHSLAELLGLGERQSALLLTLALERAGLPAVMLGPVELGLVAIGDPLNADPAVLAATVLQESFKEHAVIVVPGFVAIDRDGRSVLLGRGGSDLTALVIAQWGGQAPCRLIKDVDGIYETDPALPGEPPRRFATLPWGDALDIAGQLVQPKAITYAQAHHLEFEVGALGAPDATRVGARPVRSLLGPRPAHRLRVALFGAGTVGYGVYRHLTADPARFEVVGVAVHDLPKPRPEDLPRGLLTDDPLGLLNKPSDLVIELIGDESPAFEIMATALESGRHVVTANKAVIAQDGALLEKMAHQHKQRLCYSATVGGSLPAVELVRLAAASGPVQGLEGVLNGTCNFILDRLAEGVSFERALAEAQRRGFAEADPSRDVSGRDAASKLRILARAAFGGELEDERLKCAGIEDLTPKEIGRRTERGIATRLVAECVGLDGALRARVAPRLLHAGHEFAGVHGEWNQLRIKADGGETITARGKGAGRWPTAESVFADVMDIWRDSMPQPAGSTRSQPMVEVTKKGRGR